MKWRFWNTGSKLIQSDFLLVSAYLKLCETVQVSQATNAVHGARIEWNFPSNFFLSRLLNDKCIIVQEGGLNWRDDRRREESNPRLSCPDASG